MLVGDVNDQVTKSSICWRGRPVNLGDDVRKVIHIPAAVDGFLELLLRSYFQSQDVVFVRDRIYSDIEEHGRYSSLIVAASVIVKSVQKVKHRFNDLNVIVFEFYHAIGRFLVDVKN